MTESSRGERLPNRNRIYIGLLVVALLALFTMPVFAQTSEADQREIDRVRNEARQVSVDDLVRGVELCYQLVNLQEPDIDNDTFNAFGEAAMYWAYMRYYGFFGEPEIRSAGQCNQLTEDQTDIEIKSVVGRTMVNHIAEGGIGPTAYNKVDGVWEVSPFHRMIVLNRDFYVNYFASLSDSDVAEFLAVDSLQELDNIDPRILWWLYIEGHELGHTIGMDHIEEYQLPTPLMFPYNQSLDGFPESLTLADVDELLAENPDLRHLDELQDFRDELIHDG